MTHSAILGAAPAVRESLIDPGTLICDAKTGVSGAGIKPTQTFHYPLRYENMNAYKIAAHQHNFEIERELSRLSGGDVRVTLTDGSHHEVDSSEMAFRTCAAMAFRKAFMRGNPKLLEPS